MNVGIWETLNKLAVILLFAAGALGVFFWYLPLIDQNRRYRKEIIALDSKIIAEQKLARQLTASTDALLNDPSVLERLAREKLGYARTNEMVIRFEPPERLRRTVAPAPAPSSSPAPQAPGRRAPLPRTR
ncbi:MAG: septum formation initiator family protein [Verrucomicrobia bacterium]|nr:septum formation initiator family protein [Verrucomicrobiota bacterium]